jgi:addiction module HigA family antidote
MLSTDTFEPDYVIPPGEILTEYLESLGMSQRDLAARTGLAPKTVNEIVQGKAPITAETALKLERVVGRPAHFWQNLESLYQEARVRERDQEDLARDLDWLQRVPVKAMVELRWVAKADSDYGQLDLVLRFFGVSSVERWSAIWERGSVAYRRSQRFETHPEAVSAWLRRGEIEAQGIRCAPFDKSAFRRVLDEARDLTREPPEHFQPALVERCAATGVAVVFVPELPKTGVSGATRWLTPDKALVQLSLRYKSDDQLWFTFFHEAGHVLLHGKRDVFIEGDAMDDDKEQEANRFAADHLIPRAEFRRLLAVGRPTLDRIESFAEEVGIAPGIVVGRLQREGVLEYRVGNRLKRRLFWALHAHNPTHTNPTDVG